MVSDLLGSICMYHASAKDDRYYLFEVYGGGSTYSVNGSIHSGLLAQCGCRTQSYLKIVKGCSSRSYDAITAHTAITCAQYIMLAELQRLHQDTRSIGELFFDAFDELQDISYQQSLFLILSAILHAVTEALTLSEVEQRKMVEAFISTVSPILANRLECVA
jgi:coproporphyrinogen III oxidase